MKITRPYRMGARADAAAETGRRIVAAARDLFLAHDYEDVTLQAVAERAGVTLQTVLRRFTSKEGLATAVGEVMGPEIEQARQVSRPGDLDEAVRRLVSSYEAMGAMNWRMLRQEHRIPILHAALERGRAQHRRWIEQTFAALLPKRGRARERAVLQLFAATDFYTWKLYRVDLALARPEVERLIRALVAAIGGGVAQGADGREGP